MKTESKDVEMKPVGAVKKGGKLTVEERIAAATKKEAEKQAQIAQTFKNFGLL